MSRFSFFSSPLHRLPCLDSFPPHNARLGTSFEFAVFSRPFSVSPRHSRLWRWLRQSPMPERWWLIFLCQGIETLLCTDRCQSPPRCVRGSVWPRPRVRCYSLPQVLLSSSFSLSLLCSVLNLRDNRQPTREDWIVSELDFRFCQISDIKSRLTRLGMSSFSRFFSRLPIPSLFKILHSVSPGWRCLLFLKKPVCQKRDWLISSCSFGQPLVPGLKRDGFELKLYLLKEFCRAAL